MDMCLQDKIGDSEMSAVYHHVNKNCRKANGNNNNNNSNNNSNIYITNRFNNQLLPPNNSLFPSVLRLRTLGGAVGVEQLFELRSPKVQQRLRRAFATQAHRQHRFNVRKICPGHHEMCQNLFFTSKCAKDKFLQIGVPCLSPARGAPETATKTGCRSRVSRPNVGSPTPDLRKTACGEPRPL